VEFAVLVERARSVRRRYAELERATYGREWSAEELMLGFVKDVGDLALLVQAQEGIREADHVEEALAHELADCLWSLISLADRYGIDLEPAFLRAMDEIEAQLG
jgi:NTP pyrophosphatase (non-canonical NTP hydrolase)